MGNNNICIFRLTLFKYKCVRILKRVKIVSSFEKFNLLKWENRINVAEMELGLEIFGNHME